MKKTLKHLRLVISVAFAAAIMSINVSAAEDVYRVKKGDTLWEISQKYKVDLWNVIDSNPQFNDPDLIYPDQKVTVPLNDALPDKASGAARIGTKNQNATKKSASKGNMPALNDNAATNKGYEQQVLSLVNKERTSRGLKELNLSNNLASVARYKSADMMDKEYFGHNSPTYGDPFQMIESFGIKFTSAGENIAKGQETPSSVVNAWMNSEGHKKNILNKNYTHIGIGYVKSSVGTAYWTQIFVKQ